jgi:hypothetical protein
MGSLHAIEFAQNYDLNTGLTAHFRCNCYPPVPLVMIEPAKTAINLVVSDKPDELIELPNGCRHRIYGTKMPASAFCNEMRLEAFVEFQTNVVDPTDYPIVDNDCDV